MASAHAALSAESRAAAACRRSLRHGLANLYRPGNQSAAVLAALGTGVMLILAVYLMQAALLREIRETASPKLPNIFLIDVTTEEVAGVQDFFQHQAGVSRAARPDAGRCAGKFISLNGKSARPVEGPALSPAHAGERGLSWADAPPAGDKVTQGKWWTEPERAGDRRSAKALRSGCIWASAHRWSSRPAGTVSHAQGRPPSISADGQHLGGARAVRAAFGAAQR